MLLTRAADSRHEWSRNWDTFSLGKIYKDMKLTMVYLRRHVDNLTQMVRMFDATHLALARQWWRWDSSAIAQYFASANRLTKRHLYNLHSSRGTRSFECVETSTGRSGHLCRHLFCPAQHRLTGQRLHQTCAVYRQRNRESRFQRVL
jgi:hypothetical protein